MEDIKQAGLTLREAMKYLYLGDRIWNTWTGERHSVICHYWDIGAEDIRGMDISEEEQEPLWFWDIIPFAGLDNPKKLTWREITSPIWFAETTSESV